MEEKRKKERRETRVKVIGFGALAVCYLAMACWNCWDKRAGLGVFSAIMAAVCAGGVILEREVRNAAEYCEDMEMALSLLREKRLVNGTSIYPLLGEGIDDLFSHNEQIRIWVRSPDTGHGTCVWRGMAWMMPTEVRKLPLLRFTARCPETAEDAGYLEIETELPEGWKMKDAAGCGRPALRETGARADVGIGPYERASGVAEGMEDGTVCPRCGGRVYHTVGGKKFCSLCLEEMRRE